jgi:Ca-activated chloride channel family protein
MKFQPLAPWWLLILYLLLTMAFTGWQFWKIWQAHHKERTTLLRWLRRAGLLLLPAVLALGPSVGGGTSAPGITNLDVVVAVDTTPSLGALDYAGTQQRLAGVQKDLLALGPKVQGARLELITFDSNASVILPFTTDQSAFASAVDSITPEPSSYSQGSAIDKPIDLILQELKSSKAHFPQHQRLLFYLGDGEQTIGQPVQSFAPLAPYLNGGAVLGYGTTKGANMIDYSSLGLFSSTTTYIKTINTGTSTLVPAVSKMDPVTLQAIAQQLKVPYQDRDEGGSITSVYKASRVSLAVDHSQHIVRYLNLYWLVAIPYAGLVFWEWQAMIIKLFDLRERRGGHKHA